MQGMVGIHLSIVSLFSRIRVRNCYLLFSSHRKRCKACWKLLGEQSYL